MATPEQIAANRKNALKSTGPKTPEGKAIARWNALTHGGRARTPLLPDEDPAAFKQLSEAYFARYAPATETEHFLVSQMVLAVWRLQRLAAMEPRLIMSHMASAADIGGIVEELCESVTGQASSPDPDAPPPDPVASAYIRDTQWGSTIAAFARYQVYLERSYYRALHELNFLRNNQ